MQSRDKRAQQTGTTLTELLVVIVVLSLLASVAVPVAINRSTQGKISVARADVKALANAEEMVGMIHGFYVPLQVLDDIAGERFDIGDDVIKDETSLFVINVNIPLSSGSPLLNPSIETSAGQVEAMVDTWQGPFMSFQRFFIADNSDLTIQVDLDHPLDPWRNPYIFYAPDGVVGSGAGSFATSNNPLDINNLRSTSFSDGLLTRNDDRFDRWAVVSFGPDGISGDFASSDIFDLGDDIVHFFGHVAIEPETDIGGSPSIGRAPRPSASQRRRR